MGRGNQQSFNEQERSIDEEANLDVVIDGGVGGNDRTGIREGQP